MSQRDDGAQAPAKSVRAVPAVGDEHYLKKELYELVRSDPSIFEFLQAGSLDGLWYWDLAEPENEWMSSDFWQLFGFDPAGKQHLASEWQDMIDDGDLETALDNFDRHCQDPTHPYDQVVRYRHRDGSTVWVRCRGIAIRDEAGNPVRMLGAHTDVTALKIAESALVRETARLEQSNAELAAIRQRLEEALNTKDRFIASVSHELRTPLTAILGFSEILKDQESEMDPFDRAEMVQAIADQGLDLTHIVEDLLIAARVEAGTLQVTQVPVNLGAQAAQVLETWEPKVVKGFEIVGGSVGAVGDPTRVRQILRNLISNALRYGGEARGIDVAHRGRQARISVWDDGPGIADHDVQRIFEPYERATDARRLVGSTGLGLTISRELARLMDGDLTYRYHDGQSRFELTMPAVEG